MGRLERLVIRAGNHTLSFLKPTGEGNAEYYPYTTKSGMSVAANLRTAFREEKYLEGEDRRVLLSVNTPVVLAPIDEYMDRENFDAKQLYNYSITGHDNDEVIVTVLPDLNTVALFSVNRDLKLVVDDRFADVRIQNIMQPVWAHLYRRSMLVGQRHKLYCYFHDDRVDIFSFMQRRFKYSNSFRVVHAHDALYFILYVWKQMGLDNEADELHITGKIVHEEWLMEKLKQFIRRAYRINPTADLNRTPVSLIKNMEYDLMLS